MAYHRTLSPDETFYAAKWERLRAGYFARLGPHYAELANECSYMADIHESRLRSLEEEAA